MGNEIDYEAAKQNALGFLDSDAASDSWKNLASALLALLDERERANALLSRAEGMLSSLDYTYVPAKIRAHLEGTV